MLPLVPQEVHLGSASCSVAACGPPVAARGPSVGQRRQGVKGAVLAYLTPSLIPSPASLSCPIAHPLPFHAQQPLGGQGFGIHLLSHGHLCHAFLQRFSGSCCLLRKVPLGSGTPGLCAPKTSQRSQWSWAQHSPCVTKSPGARLCHKGTCQQPQNHLEPPRITWNWLCQDSTAPVSQRDTAAPLETAGTGCASTGQPLP